MRGLSEVMGMIDDTVFRNIVSDNSMVTPNKYQQQIQQLSRSKFCNYKKMQKYWKSLFLDANSGQYVIGEDLYHYVDKRI